MVKRFSEFGCFFLFCFVFLCRPASVLNILPQVLLVAFMHVLQQNPSSALAVSAKEGGMSQHENRSKEALLHPSKSC